ncbi:hypothetical protein WMC59_07345 [Staphylococcus delphini]
MRLLTLDGEYTPEEIMAYLDEVIKDEVIKDEVIKDEEKQNKDKK